MSTETTTPDTVPALTSAPIPVPPAPKGWIGVDLDGTLAHYDHWRGIEHIGAPIPAMVARVKTWLAQGKEVRIFTARVGPQRADVAGTEIVQCIHAIDRWVCEHIGQPLAITAVKDFGMIELWDDRAVQVIPNTGKDLASGYEMLRTALLASCGGISSLEELDSMELALRVLPCDPETRQSSLAAITALRATWPAA